MDLIAKITSPEIMGRAWRCLESRRKESGPNNSYWDFCFHRETMEPNVVDALLQGDYYFSP